MARKFRYDSQMNDSGSSLLERFKPASSAGTQLALSATMWTVVGGVLALVGAWWVLRDGQLWQVFPLLAAIGLGLAKSHFVLDRAADRISNRIIDRGNGKCIGGFLSPSSWLLVVLMAGGGRLLRSSPVPRFWIGLLYTGVGAGLFRSSRIFWRRYRQRKAQDSKLS